MASPHAAGAAALYLQTNPGATPAQVVAAVVARATSGKVTSAGTGSPNLLLNQQFGGGGTDTTPPVVSITAPAAGATVSGTVTVSASASDDSGTVSLVEFYVDGAIEGSDSSAPFSFAWNTTTASDANHTLTAKVYDPSNNMSTSAGVTVTVSNGGGGGELLTNGGFEGSSSPWVRSGNAYWSTGGYAHSGAGYTILGAYNRASGTMYQTVTIPTTASGTLTFWLNVTSSETTTSRIYDILFVEVRSTSGTLLATLGTFSNLNKGTAGVYSQQGFSLAAWKGQTVRLQFRATTDSSLATSFRVDDVSLQ